MNKIILAGAMILIITQSASLAILVRNAVAFDISYSTSQYPTAYSKICIKSDGGVDPPTASLKKEGYTYTFAQDIVRHTIEIYCSNIVVDGLGFTIQGITQSGPSLLRYSGNGLKIIGDNVTVKNVTVANFAVGFLVVGSANRIIGNRVFGGGGVWLKSAYGSYVVNNTITCGIPFLGDGIRITGGASSTLVQNNITRFGVGIYLDNVSQRTENNRICLNNLVNNKNALLSGVSSKNSWDNGQIGNYWSDYNSTDADGDGIGDKPYMINEENIDNFPLVEPITNIGFSFPGIRISVNSPETTTYNSRSIRLDFILDESVVWVGYSLDGAENVTLEGNATLAGLVNGLHSVVVYANGMFGNTGVSETISFTVAVPGAFPIVPIAVGLIVVVVSVGAGLLVYLKRRKTRS